MSITVVSVGLGWLLIGLTRVVNPELFLAYLGGALSPWVAHANILGWTVIGAEVALGGCLLLAAVFAWNARPLLLVSVITATMAVIAALVTHGGGSCGCFGSATAATTGNRVMVAGGLVFLSGAGLRQREGSESYRE